MPSFDKSICWQAASADTIQKTGTVSSMAESGFVQLTVKGYGNAGIPMRLFLRVEWLVARVKRF